MNTFLQLLELFLAKCQTKRHRTKNHHIIYYNLQTGWSQFYSKQTCTTVELFFGLVLKNCSNKKTLDRILHKRHYNEQVGVNFTPKRPASLRSFLCWSNRILVNVGDLRDHPFPLKHCQGLVPHVGICNRLQFVGTDEY